MFRYAIFLQINETSNSGEGVIDIDVIGLTTKQITYENVFYPNQEYRQKLIYSSKSGQQLGAVKQIDIKFNGKILTDKRTGIVVKQVFIEFLSSRKRYK